MKTYKEMAENALERIGNYETEQKKRRRLVAKIATPAVSFCLAAMLGFGAWRAGIFRAEAPITDNGNADSEESYHSSDNTSADNIGEVSETSVSVGNGDEQGSDDACCLLWRNKLHMGGRLYSAIETDPDGVFSVTATYSPATADITSFSYEGKTLAEWATEAHNEGERIGKLCQLLKEGDSLKYGEALYQGGAPSGEKWIKELYDDRIAYYGRELLSKYIVNGEFLKDSLVFDIEHIELTAERDYEQAYNAYAETVLNGIVRQMSEKNIACERSADIKNGLIFLVTAEELENLPLEDLGNWYFNLTSHELTPDDMTTNALQAVS